MNGFAKEVTFERIKGIWEAYVRRPDKRITPNQFRGQLESALKNDILTSMDIRKIAKEVKHDVEAHSPSQTIATRLKRYEQFSKIVDEVLSQK